MERYKVTGMSCAACSARVEKAVAAVPGVEEVSVSLLTNSMGVIGSASAQAIVQAVENAGYGASLERETESAKEEDSGSEDAEYRALKQRFIYSVGFLVVLMYISMGHTMWGWPLPSFLSTNLLGIGLVEMLLTIVIMGINRKFFISGLRGVIHGAPNMDTLVALGAGAAFVYSFCAYYSMLGVATSGQLDSLMHYLHEFYFESAATILTLITVGKMLEAKSKGRTTDALKSLLQLKVQTAFIQEGNEEREVPIEQVKIGDIFVVRPGGSVPVDGVVIEGKSSINEAALTGESIPVDKKQGDWVSAATINQQGYLVCRAERVGEDTTLSQIIQMVTDASATKAPIAKVADQVSGIFVPVVVAIAVVTILVWIFTGASFGYALARGISVLVISCPCALGLATPVAIMVGNGMGAKHGILFKTAASLEETGRGEIVVLDKTGTITEGKPRVTDIVAGNEAEILTVACSLEAKSEHPLATAIVEYGKEKQVKTAGIQEFQALPGNGLCGILEGEKVYGGKYEFISSKVAFSEEILQAAKDLAEQGKTPLYFARENKILGIIAVADTLKKESKEAITQMKNMGLEVVLLTGDNENTAKAVGNQAGVDKVIANVLPDGKEKVIRDLLSQGRVIMVGDGINDAPALTRASVGMAIGAGTDVAVDAADVVLMHSRLTDVTGAIRLGKAVLRNIHENLFWAFIYNTIGIPLAAGIWIPIFGWQLNPMFGAAAMGLSSFCVVSNALRLNLLNLQDTRKDRKRKRKNKQEDKRMTKTMKIEGMMCQHCEARVKKCLEALEGVESAEVSHESGTAVVTLTSDVTDETLKTTVEAQDYKVLGME